MELFLKMGLASVHKARNGTIHLNNVCNWIAGKSALPTALRKMDWDAYVPITSNGIALSTCA